MQKNEHLTIDNVPIQFERLVLLKLINKCLLTSNATFNLLKVFLYTEIKNEKSNWMTLFYLSMWLIFSRLSLDGNESDPEVQIRSLFRDRENPTSVHG